MKAPLALYGVAEPVRVCDRCFQEAPSENEYAQRDLPVLRRGAVLRRVGMLGRRAPTLVRLAPDGPVGARPRAESSAGAGGGAAAPISDPAAAVLEFRDPERPDSAPTLRVALADASAVREGSSELTLALAVSGSSSQIVLECGCGPERATWLRALSAAQRRARAPGLKDTVTEERRRRVSEARQKKALMRRFESKQRKLKHSREQRSAMAEKYGIRRSGS